MCSRHPEQTATALLLRQRLHSLRFHLTSLAYEPPIVFDTIQHYCATTCSTVRQLAGEISKDGFTLQIRRPTGTLYLVLYHEGASPARQRFTLAHELGHIYLGHESDGTEQERQADRFAVQLLTPCILVDELVQRWGGNLPAGELAATFGVSRAVAENRLRCRRSSPYSDADHQLLARYAALLPHPDEPLVTVL